MRRHDGLLIGPLFHLPEAIPPCEHVPRRKGVLWFAQPHPSGRPSTRSRRARPGLPEDSAREGAQGYSRESAVVRSDPYKSSLPCRFLDALAICHIPLPIVIDFAGVVCTLLPSWRQYLHC